MPFCSLHPIHPLFFKIPFYKATNNVFLPILRYIYLFIVFTIEQEVS